MEHGELNLPAVWLQERQDLEKELVSIRHEEPHFLPWAERSRDYCSMIVQKVHGQVQQNGFVDKTQEIYYYKEVRPQFISRYFFFTQVYQVELSRPSGSYEDQRPHYDHILAKIREFITDNQFLLRYVRSGATYLDDRLFFHHSPGQAPAIDPLPQYPQRAPVCCDLLIGQLLASESLQTHFRDTLEALRNPGPGTQNGPYLVWTDSKTGLTELAYALQSAGAFNNGKVELKEIIDFFQVAFHIQLGNYPRTFQEILSRKTGYTNFLDRLREKLLLRIQSIEGKYDR